MCNPWTVVLDRVLGMIRIPLSPIRNALAWLVLMPATVAWAAENADLEKEQAVRIVVVMWAVLALMLILILAVIVLWIFHRMGWRLLGSRKAGPRTVYHDLSVGEEDNGTEEDPEEPADDGPAIR